MLERKRNVFIILGVLCLLIFLPPLIHGYIYPTGGDASAEHLKVIEQITLTHPIPDQYLYTGQWIIGYPLVVLKTLFHIPLTVSFLWFNYIALVGVVLSFYFVFSRMFNKLAGVMSAIGIFALQPFVLLFLSGAIFDIIAIGIIFTWVLYFFVKALARRSWKMGIISVSLFFLFFNFHFSWDLLKRSMQTIQTSSGGSYASVVSIGITNIIQYIVVAVVCIVGLVMMVRLRKLLFNGVTKEGKLMIACLIGVCLLLVIVSAPMLKIWVVSSRPLLDGIILIFLLAMSALSLYITNTMTTKKQADYMVVCVALLVAVLWLPSWFSYTSAIKPVDKQVIAYVNKLNGGEFYGNEYVAPWVYERYLNKVYKPDSSIYIWRSKPMTGRTDPTSEWWWNPKGKDITPSADMKILASFEDKGVTIYIEGR